MNQDFMEDFSAIEAFNNILNKICDYLNSEDLSMKNIFSFHKIQFFPEKNPITIQI